MAQQVVLQSPDWQAMMRQFNDWLSAQPLYDAQTVSEIKTRMNAGVERMSAEQLKNFLGEMQQKLQVLDSPQAKEAEAYLVETFAVASPAYARKLRQQLPDVLSMTAPQINQRLSVFASKRQAKVQTQEAFEESKQQSIASNRAQLAAQRQSQERALDRAQSSAATGTNNFTQARDYFPDTGNQGGYAIPFLGGWGGGGVVYHIGGHRW